jgi:hypothetical protein
MLTNSSLWVMRYPNDAHCDCVRVRIWVIK